MCGRPAIVARGCYLVNSIGFDHKPERRKSGLVIVVVVGEVIFVTAVQRVIDAMSMGLFATFMVMAMMMMTVFMVQVFVTVFTLPVMDIFW